LSELTKNTNINIDIHITVGDNASKKKWGSFYSWHASCEAMKW
jgi:hypothetical protein